MPLTTLFDVNAHLSYTHKQTILIKTLLCLIGTMLGFNTTLRADDLPLGNADFTDGLSEWTHAGWGNDDPGMVYSTAPGSNIYQIVRSHTISADKLRYTVRYKIGSMYPATGWQFPKMTVNLVTHDLSGGFESVGAREIKAPAEYSGEWQEKTWTLDPATAGKDLAVSLNLQAQQEGQVAVHLYEVEISCAPAPASLSMRAERPWPAETVPHPITEGPFAGLYDKGPPGDASAIRLDFGGETGALIHFGLDTEGGGRETMNLLREPAQVRVGARPAMSEPTKGKVEKSAPDLIQVDLAGTKLEWKANAPTGGVTLNVSASDQQAEIEVKLPLRPSLSAVTILGGRQQKDGSVRPPFLINAPDLGLLRVSVEPPEAGVAALAGFRDGMGSRANKLDLTLTSRAASGSGVKWTLSRSNSHRRRE